MPKAQLRQFAEHHGALVGWTSQDLGDRIVLNLQTFANTQDSASQMADRSAVFMTKSQAAVLANYLLKAAGMQPPTPRKRWFASLIG